MCVRTSKVDTIFFLLFFIVFLGKLFYCKKRTKKNAEMQGHQHMQTPLVL